MNGDTFNPCNLIIDKLPILSMHPILSPTKDIIMPKRYNRLGNGINETKIGNKPEHIISRLFGLII